ncbi:TIGR03620 family F420-dependent LLM class oxidoreductase [Actinosynnema sp. CS-041913]|uniref:TIGR03620 family F420-dependent LLM class oxidoreductase n=1 Tax=Actinosynnema sp. CS-041913 TaxID=3239917 RepID=UPI003D9322FB
MSGAKVEVGRVGLWTNQLDGQPVGRVLEATREIEELGFSALWAGELFGREALTQAALLLAATSRMTIATGVANVYGRDPVTMAQGQRTLLEAYGDRFVLGLGISHPWFVEQVRGHVYGPRVATMRGYLDRMDAAPFGPPGAEKRGPRVIGAVGSKMLRLAAGRAHGALPLGMPVEHTARTRELLGPDRFLGVVLPVVLGPDDAATRDIARTYVAESLPNRADVLRELGFDVDLHGREASRLVRSAVAWGGPEAIAARVDEHLAAGADHVAFSVTGGVAEELPLAEWRELAALTRR